MTQPCKLPSHFSVQNAITHQYLLQWGIVRQIVVPSASFFLVNHKKSLPGCLLSALKLQRYHYSISLNKVHWGCGFVHGAFLLCFGGFFAFYTGKTAKKCQIYMRNHSSLSTVMPYETLFLWHIIQAKPLHKHS